MALLLTDPSTARTHDVSTDAGRVWLEELYAAPAPDYLRLNMITALTGSASGPDGTSETLSSRVDRTVLGVIREQADAVLVGAASVRAEGYVMPRTAKLVVLTRRGDLSGHRLDAASGRVVLVCPAARVDEVRARASLPGAEIVGVPGSDDIAPEAVLTALRAHALPRIVCEGGPQVAAMFADAGLIDEYCITVAPALQPAPTPFLPIRRPLDTEVVGALVDAAAFSYLRLRPRGRALAPAATS